MWGRRRRQKNFLRIDLHKTPEPDKVVPTTQQREKKMQTPQVGDLATYVMYTDRHGLVVTKVSKTGYKLTLEFLENPSIFDETYKHSNGGYRYENSDHRTGREITAYQDKEGRYYSNGTRIALGQAHYYYDLSF